MDFLDILCAWRGKVPRRYLNRYHSPLFIGTWNIKTALKIYRFLITNKYKVRIYGRDKKGRCNYSVPLSRAQTASIYFIDNKYTKSYDVRSVEHVKLGTSIIVDGNVIIITDT